MVKIILLIIIYLAFISLGLPDALLGVSWPLMRQEWHMGLDSAGIISLVVTVGTITSSLLSGRLIRRFGEGNITFLSGLLTGGALLGFAYAPSYLWFAVLALPLGFGAGSVDTALNHYVSLHFKAHHMNWLHSFWGIGATSGPVVMAMILNTTGSWRTGYQTIAVIQLILAAVILFSLPLWKKQGLEYTAAHMEAAHDTATVVPHTGRKTLHIKGVPVALMFFMFYCAAETAVGLWGSSYLVQKRGLPLDNAATWVALYYGGITLGRILAGFISYILSNRQMVLAGIAIASGGAALLLLNAGSITVMLAFILLGLGFAPLFPAMIHETPRRFGKDQAQTIIGYQMASSYFGVAVFPPLLGVVINNTDMTAFPIYMGLSVVVLLILTHALNGMSPAEQVQPKGEA